MPRIVVHTIGEEPFEFDLTDEQLAQWQAFADAKGQALDESLTSIIEAFIATHPIIAQTRTPQ